MSYVSAALRQLVTQRAGNRCEYCLFPQKATLFTFEMEHIVAEKHGGATLADNLALACPYCNRAKGTDLGSIDPVTNKLTPFFNPRTQRWQEHFQLSDEAEIVPLTPEGRVTTNILQLNDSERRLERQQLFIAKQYPG
ncbi:HNH endonuclease [Nodosilinea nodulosa]|uniref:HNH endonuclease n=1 Tax=Nodosilinea nodulosa TaxID=416001 RepID=UPI000474B5CA|nr:HNH endonuclease signature motif containing protein [Nodosilinea nodulosa]